MMLKRQESQETPSSLPLPTYQSPNTLTPPNHVTSTAMIPEFVYKNTVASNPVLPSPPMHNQSENDTLDDELRSKLSELVDQISKEESTSSDDESIRKVIDRRRDGERVKESDRVRQRERKNEAQKESNGKIELENKKRKMERLNERWIERQISRECEESDVVRQRHRERNQKREGNYGVERQMEKQDWDREQKMEGQRQVERSWQVRQVETESENERKSEKVKSLEIEPHTIIQVNGLIMIRDLQESETQQVTISFEKAKEGGADVKKSVEEEEHSEKGHYMTEERVNRGLLQRSNSERGSEKRSEAHSHSTPSDPEDQTSPTEVSMKSPEPESVGQISSTHHLFPIHSSKYYINW